MQFHNFRLVLQAEFYHGLPSRNLNYARHRERARSRFLRNQISIRSGATSKVARLRTKLESTCLATFITNHEQTLSHPINPNRFEPPGTVSSVISSSNYGDVLSNAHGDAAIEDRAESS